MHPSVSQAIRENQSVISRMMERTDKQKISQPLEQTYWARSKVGSVRSDRANSFAAFKPYSSKPQDDAVSYFEYKDKQKYVFIILNMT